MASEVVRGHLRPFCQKLLFDIFKRSRLHFDWFYGHWRLYSTLPRKLWPDNFDPIFFCPQTNFDPIFFVLKNFDFMTTLPSDQLCSHLFCPEKLWLHDNFDLKPTLIPFILSWKTLTSWQLCPQTNFDPIYFVPKNFDFMTTLIPFILSSS